MAVFEQEILKPGSYRVGGGRERTFSARQLRVFMRNTLELMRSGYRIPVLSRHAVPGSTQGGPFHSSRSGSREPMPDTCVGELVGLKQRRDGTLVQTIEVADSRHAEAIAHGTLRHTSPELRAEFTDATGRQVGPVIAHVALTRRPRHAEQPPLRQPDDVVRLSLDDLISGDPSMSNLETTNDSASENVLDVETAIDQERQRESGSDDARLPEEPGTGEAGGDAIVDENDAPTTVGDTTQAEPQTTAETPHDVQTDRAETFRRDLAGRIERSSRLPRGLRTRLARFVGAVQLSSDGEEEPSLRVSDAVAMLEEALPEQLTLDADNVDAADHPGGESFFSGDPSQMSDDEADRIAREQLASTGFAPLNRQEAG